MHLAQRLPDDQSRHRLAVGVWQGGQNAHERRLTGWGAQRAWRGGRQCALEERRQTCKQSSRAYRARRESGDSSMHFDGGGILPVVKIVRAAGPLLTPRLPNFAQRLASLVSWLPHPPSRVAP
jgi:hypothetical protein